MLTERAIQKALQVNTQGFLIPNIYLYSHESDLLKISFDFSRVHEYEIKSRRADYLDDFAKGKHSNFKSLYDISDLPNTFYYVCEEGLIDAQETPEYAGLIYVCVNKHNSTAKYLKHIKKAPYLHNEKVSEWQKEKIIKSLYNRKF